MVPHSPKETEMNVMNVLVSEKHQLHSDVERSLFVSHSFQHTSSQSLDESSRILVFVNAKSFFWINRFSVPLYVILSTAGQRRPYLTPSCPRSSRLTSPKADLTFTTLGV